MCSHFSRPRSEFAQVGSQFLQDQAGVEVRQWAWTMGSLTSCFASFLPQAEGYVIGSCIKHIPIAGRDITYFIQQLLREREVGIPPEQSLETAKAIKVKTAGKPAGLG